MEEYEELGLTQNESKVYDSLVSHGKLGAGEVSNLSGVSYSKIYNVLGRLVARGLVYVVPEKSKKFAPSSPEFLVKLIEEKQAGLEKAKEKARELKKFYDLKDKNPVVMEVGRKGFYKIVSEMRKAEEYEYNIKWSGEWREEWARDAERNRKKGVDARTLARYDKETKGNIEKWLSVNKNIKRFSNEGAAFSIIDNAEVMISLIKSNVTLLIKDKPFARIMKKLFLSAYDCAKKIK